MIKNYVAKFRGKIKGTKCPSHNIVASVSGFDKFEAEKFLHREFGNITELRLETALEPLKSKKRDLFLWI